MGEMEKWRERNREREVAWEGGEEIEGRGG